MKLISLTVFRRLALNEGRFGLDTELTATLLRLGIRPFEVPVSYYSRSHAEGKKIGWQDAVSCVVILMKVRLRSRKRLFALESGPIGLVARREMRTEPPAVNSAANADVDLSAASLQCSAGYRRSSSPTLDRAGFGDPLPAISPNS
jgi:hypothetical protein